MSQGAERGPLLLLKRPSSQQQRRVAQRVLAQVPGTLHFLAKSAGHSFDHQTLNMSHVINYLYFGSKPSPRRRKV